MDNIDDWSGTLETYKRELAKIKARQTLSQNRREQKREAALLKQINKKTADRQQVLFGGVNNGNR